jgi:hypothetical protein
LTDCYFDGRYFASALSAIPCLVLLLFEHGTGPLLRERVLRRRKAEGRNAVGKDPSELTYPRIGWAAATASVALFLRCRVRVIGSEKMQ